VAQIGAALVAAVSLATAYDRTPERVRDAWTRLHQPTPSALDRELAPAASHEVSVQALTAASSTIPPDATYAIVTGDEPPLDSAIALAAELTLRDWLLPRTYVARPVDADWVITYHYPSEKLPVHGDEIGLGPDANLVHVRR
jgi:hypothetical protein